MPAEVEDDDISIEEYIANLPIPPSKPPKPLPSEVLSGCTRVSDEEFIRLMKAAKAPGGVYDAASKIARSQSYRQASLSRERRKRATLCPIDAGLKAPSQRQRKSLYAHGAVPLDTVAQLDDDTRWLPFGNGPSSYYWLWRFKRSKEELRKALKMSKRWEAATRHRIDIANGRHIPWVHSEIFLNNDNEEAARWRIVRSIAGKIGYEPQQSWQAERDAFDKVMGRIRTYNRKAGETEIKVELLCRLIEITLCEGDS